MLSPSCTERVLRRKSSVAASRRLQIHSSLFLALLVAMATTNTLAPVSAWGGAKNKATVEVECAADGTCTDAKKSASSSTNQGSCTVYMAPSTLGVDTSMGIYTAVPLEPDTVVNFPEIAVPLLFREFGDHVEGYEDGVLWDRYVWEGDVMEIETYIDTNRHASRAVFVPGVGCTVNSVLDMNNIHSTHGSDYSTVGLHRSKDPGSGAFTPYHNAKTIASKSLPAGAELFASYGDYWIPDLPGAQIALEPKLEEAEHFLRTKYYPFIRDHTSELSAEMKEALWEFTTKDFPVYSQAMTNLPRFSWAEVELELQKENTSTSTVRDFIRKQSVKPVEWLEEFGYCQDHLKPGPSTIEQAGFGAFAYRDLPKGTVLGYAPLVHVGIHAFDIWTVDVGVGHHSRKQYDLILNYSFRHPNSTVMLTPYGGGVNYINHGGKKKANVKLQWPNKELIAHKPDYLTRSPAQLRDTVDKIGLSFEYVALRNIKEGEEVFLDYGDEWEKAWREHVAQWKPVEDASKYVHSSNWNETLYRAIEEQQKNPYPSNLHTMCHESYTLSDGAYVWVEVLRPLPDRVYCQIIDRTDETEEVPFYIVELRLNNGEKVVVRDVPAEGIFLYDKSFSADWHLPTAFRHEIGIPDDIMPEAWMNGPPPQRQTA